MCVVFLSGRLSESLVDMRPRWNMSIYVPGFGQLFQCCRLPSLLSSTAGDCVHYIFWYLGDKLSKCCPVSDNRGYSTIPSMYKKVGPRNLRWGWDVSHPHTQELGWLCMTQVDEPNGARDDNTFSSLVNRNKINPARLISHLQVLDTSPSQK